MRFPSRRNSYHPSGGEETAMKIREWSNVPVIDLKIVFLKKYDRIMDV